MLDALIGSELAAYRISAVLARGGMGVVYLAEDTRLGRRVALKLLPAELAADDRFRRRFLRESRLMAALDHPNVIPVYEAGEAADTLFIAMRYVDGPSLAAVLEREGRLEPGRALDLLEQAAEALDAAHEAGLIHRDVKPGNVLVASRGTTEHVYLSDFGLTRERTSASSLTEAGQFMGTADYLAPEVLDQGEAGPGADVYALGCVLFECLVGTPPFRRDSLMTTLWAHVNDEPPSLHERRRELPRELDAIVARALAKDPDERYPTCRALVDAARGLLAGEAAARARPRLAGRPRRLAALGAVPLAAGAIALGLVLARGSDDPVRAGEAPSTAPSAAPGTDAVQRIDPETDRLTATIQLGGSLAGIAAETRWVWAVDSAARTILKLDARTGRLLEERPTGIVPGSVATDRGRLIVASTGATATAMDVERETLVLGGTFVREIPSRPPVGGRRVLAIGIGSLWVGDVQGAVLRYPWGTAASLRVAVPSPVRGIVLDEQGPWVAAGDGLTQIDPLSGEVVGRVGLPFTPGGIAAGAGRLWVSDTAGGRVVAIDPESRRILASSAVGEAPGDVVVAWGSVWVANRGDGTVSRVDPRLGRAVATIRVGRTPVALAAGVDALWVVVDVVR